MKKSKGSLPISWQRLSLIALCVVLFVVLVGLISGTAYIQHLIGLVTVQDPTEDTISEDDWATMTEPSVDPTDLTGPSVGHEDVTISTIPSTPPEELIVDGVYNILLIGEDRRAGQSRQRSDSMILCSFNTNNNTITMISFLRDTYVAIPGKSPNKLNAPYAGGGASLLNQTLALNFGVHVDGNVMVDFEGFKGVIDLLGGVDIKLTEREANHLNEKYGWNLSSGTQHLNGTKALAYSRIRKIDMDARRAERQRKVLTALINAYKSKSPTEMLTLSTQILETGFVKTNMTASQLTGYITKLGPMLATATINSQQIPADGTYTNMHVGDIVDCKVIDFEVNRKILESILTAK